MSLLAHFQAVTGVSYWDALALAVAAGVLVGVWHFAATADVS